MNDIIIAIDSNGIYKLMAIEPIDIIELDCDDEEYLTSQLDRLKDLSQWACSENQMDIGIVTDALIGTITTRLSQMKLKIKIQYKISFQ